MTRCKNIELEIIEKSKSHQEGYSHMIIRLFVSIFILQFLLWLLAQCQFC
ncbi:unnamed protein product [Amoebophrya sp. A25]|nr:unnamed protein product [Amoebophrya sp. A25]|eukprot:GSA25T00018510001.1